MCDEKLIGRKVYKMTYLLLMTILTNAIQIMQPRWKWCMDRTRDYVKKLKNKIKLIWLHSKGISESANKLFS